MAGTEFPTADPECSRMIRPALSLSPALASLIDQPRWVIWKWKKGKNGRWTKPPYQDHSPNTHANCSKPETWCDFETVTKVYCDGTGNGIGFVILGNGIGAFDVDDCRDSVTGKLDPWADDLVKRCGSYCEVTPSKKGIRIIGRTSGPKVQRKFPVPGASGVSVELYRDCERFITVSGNQVGDAGLANIDAPFDALLAELDGKKKNTNTKTESSGKQHDLASLIKNGCGDDFGGDRSRAVWYVINQLLNSGHDQNYIVALLLDRTNGISAHIYDQSNPEAYARRQVEKAKGTSDVDAEIKRLAQLSAVQYERERKTVADRLNIRAPVLDKLVQAERPNDHSGQGRAVKIEDAPLWHEPVNGDQLAILLADTVKTYAVMLIAAAHVIALWIMYSWAVNAFTMSPRLAIVSATKGCGKTTIIRLLNRLVRRPKRAGSITPAALFRVGEQFQPTILMDETEKYIEYGSDLHALIRRRRKTISDQRRDGLATPGVPEI